MIDKDVAYASPATVYNIMKRNSLINKWNQSGTEHEKGFRQPEKQNEQWHTDFAFVKISGVFYYFAAVLDEFSRKILVWDLFQDMTEFSVEILITKAKDLYPDETPRIIHDNGSQYTNDDLKKLLAQFGMADSKTRQYHPQSNGKIERFHRTLRTEHVRRTPYITFSDTENQDGGMDYILQFRTAEWSDFLSDSR